MPELAAADLYNDARGFTDWKSLDPTKKQQYLLQAADYIEAAYPRLKRDLSEDQQDAVDRATFIIARDLATNPMPLAVRATTPVIKETGELKGLKEVMEYGDVPADPYPRVTALLTATGCLCNATAGFSVARLVRG